MKKRFLLLSLLSLFGLGFGVGCLIGNEAFKPAYAEEEVVTYSISYSQPEHGKIVIAEEDLTGEVGKVVDVNIDPSLFYLVNSVTVNGTALVESETTKGLYSFSPVAGENVLEVSIVLDEELFGEFNTIAKQVEAKDWASIFSTETIVRLVGIVLNSGLLLAIVVYFIKDKRLADKVGNMTKKTLESTVTPEVKAKVEEAIKNALKEPFEKMDANNLRTMQAMAVFSKCMALAQEDTAESRKAIIDELASLEIGDLATLEQIRKFIAEEVNAKNKVFEENMAKLQAIKEENSKNVTEEEPVKEEEKPHSEEEHYDGTEI